MRKKPNKNGVRPRAGKNGHSVRIGKLSEFRPQVANANKHTERGLRMLDDAMSEDGYVAGMTATADKEVIDGSARLERAFDKFNDEAIIIEHDGKRPIITVRTDIPNAGTKEAKRIAVRANRIAEVDLAWDASILQALEPAELAGMFSDKELNEILADIQQEPKDAEPQIDKAEELRQKWGTETGQLWVIGNHRLLVGDATNKADVGRVCANNKPALMLADPPYGIDRDEGFGGFGGFGPPIARRKYKGDWDSERPAKETFDLILEISKSSVIFGGNYFADLLPQSKHWIVWDKLNTMPTFGDCELAWTNIARTSVKKYTVEYNGLIGKEKERFHATQKPEALFRAILNDYSKSAETMFDPFVGSGTTLVAAENLKRKCYAIEISASYVAVCLERMTTAFPHLKIEKAEKAVAA